jgi:hypothetical protein
MIGSDRYAGLANQNSFSIEHGTSTRNTSHRLNILSMKLLPFIRFHPNSLRYKMIRSSFVFEERILIIKRWYVDRKIAWCTSLCLMLCLHCRNSSALQGVLLLRSIRS